MQPIGKVRNFYILEFCLSICLSNPKRTPYFEISWEYLFYERLRKKAKGSLCFQVFYISSP